MKKLSILFLLMFTTLVFSTTNDSIQKPSTAQEVERLVDKYGGKIIDGFNTVVEKTTPIAEQGFYIAVKLNIAKGIGELLPLLFFFGFGYLFIREYNRINNILNSDNVPYNMHSGYGPMDFINSTPLLWISLTFIVILFIFSLFTTMSGIQHLIAPEWYAIKDIIDLFKE
jgi:hypothetical protein